VKNPAWSVGGYFAIVMVTSGLQRAAVCHFMVQKLRGNPVRMRDSMALVKDRFGQLLITSILGKAGEMDVSQVSRIDLE